MPVDIIHGHIFCCIGKIEDFPIQQNAIIAIAFEISSFYSETQIGEKKSLEAIIKLLLKLIFQYYHYKSH